MTYKQKNKRKGTVFGTLTPEGKVTNTMTIDLSKVKSNDPLAYSFGFFEGKSGKPISKEKGLASEYIRGFKEGKKAKK